MTRTSVALACTLIGLAVVTCRPDAPKDGEADDVSEHAVIVHLRLSNDDFGTREETDAIHALSERLEAAILAAQAGEFDGDEFGGGECVLYMYGTNADSLFAAIEAELRASSLSRGGWAIKRYGPAEDPSASEVRVDLEPG